MAATDTDLICAIATPPGEGGVGIIRLSGPSAKELAQTLVSVELTPRRALYSRFMANDETLDDGIVLWFPGPNSFTGEDVVELQGHGGPVVQQTLLKVLCDRGARLARPGEFSERAFLNGKLDLVQAEAIADLIAAKSSAAAKAALSSFQGVFSEKVTTLADRVKRMRVEIEAAIDFPDEDIEILEQAQVAQTLATLIDDTSTLLIQAEQGRKLSQGMTVALVGEPNVGKSSLLNALSGEEAAIVTEIPGTTRDLLKVDVVIDGIPLRLVDTAGLRDSDDTVERIGVERARAQIAEADYVVVVMSAGTVLSSGTEEISQDFLQLALDHLHSLGATVAAEDLHLVINKIDLGPPAVNPRIKHRVSLVSAKEGDGLSAFASTLAKAGGASGDVAGFSARARHVQALQKTIARLKEAQESLNRQDGPELVAEDCLRAHQTLGEIVGTLTPDELLGEIFSTFCIGK